MRYGSDQKQETRDRIIETAGRRLKSDGIDGSGVATLMADAGLTNGAFYNHFSSKEDLVGEVLVAQLRAQRNALDKLPGLGGLKDFVALYLSPEHRDHPGDGCPSAALLDEIVRRPKGTRRAFTDELRATAEDIAGRLDGADRENPEAQVLEIFASMIGVLQLARSVSDPDLSDELLRRGRETALERLAELAS